MRITWSMGLPGPFRISSSRRTSGASGCGCLLVLAFLAFVLVRVWLHSIGVW